MATLIFDYRKISIKLNIENVNLSNPRN